MSFCKACGQEIGTAAFCPKCGAAQAGSLRLKLDELRTFALSRLTKIRESLSRPGNVAEAHEALAEQFGCITLEPVSENGKRSNLAHGKVDFFGEEIVAHSGGAGGRNSTLGPSLEFRLELVA